MATKYPSIALDGKSQDYVDGLYTVATATDGLPAPAVPAAPPAPPALSAREKMLADMRNVKPVAG